MPPRINHVVLLASRPQGAPTLQNFRIEAQEVREPREGELLLEILYLSLDPYMRGRMDAAKSYAAPVAVGGVMEGGTVARVVISKHSGFAVGEIVLSHSGWQQFALSDGIGVRKLDPELAPVTTALGVLGMPGFTAYAGLLNIGRPKLNETVVVAAASGAVGSAVGQIARILGARAVGIAGGPEKCAFVRDQLGFDAVVDHRSPDFLERLVSCCPDGVDVYFENVGGAVWDAIFPLLNPFARIPVCGLISSYNDVTPAVTATDRLANAMRDVLSKSLTVRGFIQREFADQRPDFYRDATTWMAQGRLRYKEDVVDGLEKAPEALIAMLRGGNFGKLLIRVA